MDEKDHAYELKSFIMDETVMFYELIKRGSDKTGIASWMDDPKRRESFAKLVKQIARIRAYGIQKSCGTGKLRCLDSAVGLYEIKGFAGALREMCCIVIDADMNIVLLFDFAGHKGSGNISCEISRGRSLAETAQNLLRNR